jgi:hypothetical protein
VGINNLGQVVGYFSNATSERIGYYLDLDLIGGGTDSFWDYLPTPSDSSSSYGKQINDNQDVLIYSPVMSQGHLCNLDDLASGTWTLTDPTSGVPFAFSTATRVDLNNLGQVVGNTLDSSVFRLTPGVLLEFPPLDNSMCSINDAGLMAGTLPATGSRKRGTPRQACRYDSEGQIEVLSSVESFAYDINNDGDVAGRVEGNNAVYHDSLDTWYLLDNLVVGSDADLDLWYQTTGKRAINIADRGATGFGQMLALVNTTSSTGSGKNKVTTTVTRFFVLTPELP